MSSVIDMRRAGTRSLDVSEPGATVSPMSHSHTCIWYEDDWPDHKCDCGARAVLVIDDDGEAVLVALDVETPAVPHQHLAISA